MRVPSIIVTCYAMFCCFIWETFSFLKGKREGADLKEKVDCGWGRTGRRTVRGNCCWVVTYDIKINKK